MLCVSIPTDVNVLKTATQVVFMVNADSRVSGGINSINNVAPVSPSQLHLH